MIKDFGLKIFNCSQNFYLKCGLGAAQNFTASRNFTEAEAHFNARNFNAQTSRSASDTAARCFNAETNSNGTLNSAVAHNPASIRTRAVTQNFISRAVSSYADQKRPRPLLSPRARRIECSRAPCHVAACGSNLLSPRRRAEHGSNLSCCRAEHRLNSLARTITLES